MTQRQVSCLRMQASPTRLYGKGWFRFLAQKEID